MQDQGPDGILGEALETASYLCHPILPVRVPLPGQHHRAALPDEQVLRRRVLVLRSSGNELLRDAPGGQSGSDGVRVPQGDQVYLPQIWCVRIHSEARLAVYPATEHCQREDVHLHLVLVYYPVHYACGPHDLQVRS